MFQLPMFTIIFLTGLAVGSFLNCLIYRLALHQNFGGGLTGRSYCPHCKHILSWQDLIPVLSFLILKGKCRYCSQKISWQYPLVEFFTGILFVLIFYQTIYDLRFTIYELIITCFLIVIFVYDLKHSIIPDKVVYPAIAITFIYQLFRILNLEFVSNFELRISNLFLSVLPSLFFLAIILISRGQWMGFGDFKLAILMGLFLGFPNILVALFSAFLIGAIIGIGLILAGKKTLKSEVPFGPFLVTGTFLALFLGQRIINFYVQSFYPPPF